MFKNSLLAAAAVALVSTAGAQAAVIDFDTLSGDVSGVDLGGLVLQTGEISVGPNGTNGILPSGQDFAQIYRADFTVSGVTSVSVDLGDFNQDEDNLYLFAYAADDSLLDADFSFIDGAFVGMVTLSVSTVMEIAYIEFYGEGLNDENNVYADNIVFNSGPPAVPLPAGGLLMLGGLGAFAAMRRVRK